MNSRDITIYATKGKGIKTINTDVAEWQPLRDLLRREGYDMNSLHATESINRTDLINDNAKLPEGPFTVFLRPKKTKSGVGGTKDLSFKELRSMVKQLQDHDGADRVKEKLGNYTQLSTENLRSALASYRPKPGFTFSADGTATSSKSTSKSSSATKAKKKASPKKSSPKTTSKKTTAKKAAPKKESAEEKRRQELDQEAQEIMRGY